MMCWAGHTRTSCKQCNLDYLDLVIRHLDYQTLLSGTSIIRTGHHLSVTLIIRTSFVWHLDYPDIPRLKQCTRMHAQRVGSVSIWECGDH